MTLAHHRIVGFDRIGLFYALILTSQVTGSLLGNHCPGWHASGYGAPRTDKENSLAKSPLIVASMTKHDARELFNGSQPRLARIFSWLFQSPSRGDVELELFSHLHLQIAIGSPL
jgi:hypothetical protein